MWVLLWSDLRSVAIHLQHMQMVAVRCPFAGRRPEAMRLCPRYESTALPALPQGGPELVGRARPSILLPGGGRLTCRHLAAAPTDRGWIPACSLLAQLPAEASA